MFLKFFANLRQAHVPVTPREYLDLMRALHGDLAQMSVEEFYRLARALLIKDERNLDKFDVVFAWSRPRTCRRNGCAGWPSGI
jgi:uncharacterized protein with von Willebrand factor type A (vWA) domain